MTTSSNAPGQRPSVSDMMARQEEQRAASGRTGSTIPADVARAGQNAIQGAMQRNASPRADDDEKAPAASRGDDKRPAPAQEDPDDGIPIQRRISSFPGGGYDPEGLKVEGWFEWADRKGSELFHEVWEGVGESWNGKGRSGALAAQDAKHHDHRHQASVDPDAPGPTPPGGAPRGRSGGRNA